MAMFHCNRKRTHWVPVQPSLTHYWRSRLPTAGIQAQVGVQVPLEQVISLQLPISMKVMETTNFLPRMMWFKQDLTQ